jgi:bifunctional oligoribonuclease and PAP phosphatase NrnA
MQITLIETIERLEQAKNIVITAHVNPDGDAIGSSLALRHYLVSIGKTVRLLLDDDISADFSFLPGHELFEKPQGNGIDADLLIVLDTSIDRIGMVRECVHAPILNIDHHISNDAVADYLYLDAGKAATGEIIFALLQKMQAKLTFETSVCMYTAIATDCGFFRYSNTTAFTMEAGAELLRFGVKPNEISEALEKRPWLTVKGKAAALQTTEFFPDKKIAIAIVTKEVLDECASTGGLIDEIRVIDGVDIAVVVKYVEDGISRVSMRSKYTDVSAVALTFEGGGHIRAAGCTIKAPLLEAKQLILHALKDHMEAKCDA